MASYKDLLRNHWKYQEAYLHSGHASYLSRPVRKVYGSALRKEASEYLSFLLYKEDSHSHDQ